jgi:hypothetical protein
MKTYVHLWQYLTQFFLKWEMFQTKLLEKIKKRILCSIMFSRKSCRFWDNVEKYCTAGQATDDNIIRRMRLAYWIAKATDTLRICHTFWFSMRTFVTRTRLNVTFIRTFPSCSWGIVQKHVPLCLNTKPERACKFSLSRWYPLQGVCLAEKVSANLRDSLFTAVNKMSAYVMCMCVGLCLFP